MEIKQVGKKQRMRLEATLGTIQTRNGKVIDEIKAKTIINFITLGSIIAMGPKRTKERMKMEYGDIPY